MREATYSQNAQNNKGYPKKIISLTGTSHNYRKNNKWTARITNRNKRIYLGTFATELEAHEAYKKASLKIHGDFSVYNQQPKEK